MQIVIDSRGDGTYSVQTDLFDVQRANYDDLLKIIKDVHEDEETKRVERNLHTWIKPGERVYLQIKWGHNFWFVPVKIVEVAVSDTFENRIASVLLDNGMRLYRDVAGSDVFSTAVIENSFVGVDHPDFRAVITLERLPNKGHALTYLSLLDHYKTLEIVTTLSAAGCSLRGQLFIALGNEDIA